MDLFDQPAKEPSLSQPLAERMRPRTLKDFVGHTDLTGEGKFLHRLFHQKKMYSVIFWGPPGSGKTTLAIMIANYIDAKFYQLNAVSAGVKNVREVLKKAEFNQQRNIKSVLFIDEIHRFNKGQQDALLHAVEKGLVIFVGATTENPSFEVNSPLLSRCRVIKLSELDKTNLKKILYHALDTDELLKTLDIQIDREAEEFLLDNVGGDARKLLNGIEVAVDLAKRDNSKIRVSLDNVKEALQKKNLLYDKKGDYHYDVISAFIKSIRGSDPDAAVYWMTVMLEGGEDPMFIARRMVIAASEDVGNANPSALMLANAGIDAVHKVGMPEAGIILSQVATYLAASPKSNAAYMAYQNAKELVKNTGTPNVPLHLRNAPTKLMKDEGYGKNYKYPHDFPGHFTAQDYLPENIAGTKLYHPTDIGREKGLKDYLEEK
ncbi:MAG: replication-associated recombination protein A [Fidelibacterota bacterium]